LRTFLGEHPAALSIRGADFDPALTELQSQLLSKREVGESVERRLIEWMQRRIADLQQTDRRYWREIIAELKSLRSTGRLVKEGSAI